MFSAVTETIHAVYWETSSRAAIHALSREKSNARSQAAHFEQETYDRGDNCHSDIATGSGAIVMGGGRYTDALSAVAHRLARRTDGRILLLEAGGSDLVAGSLIPETWYLNQTGPLDWNFGDESSPCVNGCTIAHAGGRALGGSTAINRMV